MPAIPNSWVEKIKKKKEVKEPKAPPKFETTVLKMNMNRSLRGVRR